MVYRNYTTMQNVVISRNSNFVPQKIVYFNPDGGQERGSDVKVLGHNVKVIGLYAKVPCCECDWGDVKVFVGDHHSVSR